MRLWEQVRHHRVQPKDPSDERGERWYDNLDLRAVESAFRLLGIRQQDWPDRLEDLLFLEDLTCQERGRSRSYDWAEDYPESLLLEPDDED